MDHNLDIPERLHTPLKVATLLLVQHGTNTLLTFLGSAQERDIPLTTDAYVVPTDVKTLAEALTFGFGCNFGGFVQPNTETWKELKHLEGVVSELLSKGKVQSGELFRSMIEGVRVRRLDPWACPRRERPLEDIVQEKRDAVFKQMVDTPDRLDIWGNPIRQTEDPMVVTAPVSKDEDPMVVTAPVSKDDYFGDHPPSLPALALAIAKSKFSKCDPCEVSLRDVYVEICEAKPSPKEMFMMAVFEGLDVDRALAYAKPKGRGGVCGFFDVLAIEQELQEGE